MKRILDRRYRRRLPPLPLCVRRWTVDAREIRRPASRIRKTRSDTHPLPLSERERSFKTLRSPFSPLSTFLPRRVFLYFSPAPLLSSVFSSSSSSEFLPLVLLSLSISPACTHLPAERGRTCPTVALRLNELRWRRRRDRFVAGAADHLDPRPRAIHNTRPRVRGASVTRGDTCVRSLGLLSSSFSARSLESASSSAAALRDRDRAPGRTRVGVRPRT